MPLYEKNDYDILSNAPMDQRQLTLFPGKVFNLHFVRYGDTQQYHLFSDKIFNIMLFDKWSQYVLKVHNLTPQITEHSLYKVALSEKILAFSYALFENANDQNALYAYFRVIRNPSSNYKDHHWLDSYYVKPQVIDAPLPIPLNIFVPKRLRLPVNIDMTACSECDGLIINGHCRGLVAEKKDQSSCCSRYVPFDFNGKMYVTNTDGRILFDMDYVNEHISLRNNTMLVQNVCYVCNNCKKCKKLERKCHQHKICRHKIQTNISKKILGVHSKKLHKLSKRFKQL